jgi:hypothetical protein
MRLLHLTPGIVVLLIFVLPCVRAQNTKGSATITVTGTLDQVVGVGGETTGWAIKLDSETEFAGKRSRSIEVSGDRREFVRLKGKRVNAAGKLVVRHGIERGEWPVLEISSIQEVKSSQSSRTSIRSSNLEILDLRS